LNACFCIVTLTVLLTACEKMSVAMPWESPAPIQLQIEGVPTSGKESMLMLNDQLEPLKKPSYQVIRRDFFDCNGMVAPWMQNLLVAEMNFLADKYKFLYLENPICLLSINKDEGPKNGRFSVHFYKDEAEMKACVLHQKCSLARNVSLILKNQSVYRSYFLSDFVHEKYDQHCITPDSKWLANTTCYTIE